MAVLELTIGVDNVWLRADSDHLDLSSGIGVVRESLSCIQRDFLDDVGLVQSSTCGGSTSILNEEDLLGWRIPVTLSGPSSM